MKRFIIAACAVVLAFTVGILARTAAEPVDLDAARAAVNSVLDQYYQCVETEDMELFSKIMAHDPEMVCFGTDAAERMVGYQSLEDSWKRLFASTEDFTATSRERVITVHRSGEVAWWSEFMDSKGKAQGQPFAFEGARFTGVLEKRNGDWVIVHFHASVPVSGQAVKY